MKITILIDNSPSDNKELKHEHGFSAFIQTGKTNVLCDMGASDSFIENSELLGINLNTIDFAFISHGHSDHTGGLQTFIEKYQDKDIFIPQNILNDRYYSHRHASKRDISTRLTDEARNSKRLKVVDKSEWITSDIAIIKNIYTQNSKPHGNIFLYKSDHASETEDDFSHEQSLAIKTDKGLVVVSPCSHCGAVNIMKSCCHFSGINKVALFIGGMHIVEGDNTERESIYIISEIKKEYPDTIVLTGHCTCDHAKDILRSKSSNISIFRTGTSFSEDMFAN